jgi:hypothetical protein
MQSLQINLVSDQSKLGITCYNKLIFVLGKQQVVWLLQNIVGDDLPDLFDKTFHFNDACFEIYLKILENFNFFFVKVSCVIPIKESWK